jgi:8-oxo-dGTP pyrophosphatase MutT (NUDIX family)
VNELYNPNVAYELAIMHYQGKECLILINDKIKDRKPFDIISKLHKSFKTGLDVRLPIRDWIDTIIIREKDLLNVSKDRIALAVVMKPDSKEFLLTKRRHREGKLEWGFPAKTLMSYYNVEEAIIFECIQETGITPNPIGKFGDWFHPDTGKFAEYWFCEYESGTIKITDTDELLEARWLSGPEVLEMVESQIYPPLIDMLKGRMDSPKS